jgi:hypothetical protein
MDNHSSYNQESLEALASGDKSRMLAIVLAHIRRCGRHGTIADEACAALDLGPNSVAPRLTELEDAGLVVRLRDHNGQRVRRETRQGCQAAVYVAVEFAALPPIQPSLFSNLTPWWRDDG